MYLHFTSLISLLVPLNSTRLLFFVSISFSNIPTHKETQSEKRCKWSSGAVLSNFQASLHSQFSIFTFSSSFGKAVSESPDSLVEILNEVLISMFSNKSFGDLFYVLFAIISWRFVLKYNKCEWMNFTSFAPRSFAVECVMCE